MKNGALLNANQRGQRLAPAWLAKIIVQIYMRNCSPYLKMRPVDWEGSHAHNIPYFTLPHLAEDFE